VATAQPPARLLDDSFLRILPSSVREPRRAWLAILTGYGLSIIGSLVLAFLVGKIAPDLAKPDFKNLTGPVAILLLVVISPFIETLIMGGILVGLQRFLPPAPSILVSALLWGILHSLGAPSWGLAIWWPFLIFSTLFVVWRHRGFWVATGVVTATHALQNLVPALAVAGYI
jgi:membrane protease YdiL (CAAX protease family)